MNKEKFLNILNGVAQDIKKRDHIDFDLHILSKEEYYQYAMDDKEFLDCSVKDIIELLSVPFNAKGWYGYKSDEVFLLYDVKNILRDFQFSFISLLHECRHKYQEEHFDNYSKYQRFLFYIEHIIMNADYKYYLKNHDSFLIEIDADLFALDNALPYVNGKKKYIKQSYFDRYRDNSLINFKLYDDIELFDYYCSIVMNNDNIDDFKDFDSDYGVENFLFPGGKSLVSFFELYDRRHLFDEGIVNLIMSSKTMLDSIKYTDLNIEEIDYLISIINNVVDRIDDVRDYIVGKNLIFDYGNKFRELYKKKEYYKKIMNKLNLMRRDNNVLTIKY